MAKNSHVKVQLIGLKEALQDIIDDANSDCDPEEIAEELERFAVKVESVQSAISEG